MPLIKPTSPMTADPPKRSEYGIIYQIRHRNWRKLTPEQRATILRAGADQLDAWAGQMREEARLILD
jgi:hypothetical protein